MRIKLLIVVLFVFLLTVAGFLWRQNYIQEKRIEVLIDLVENKNEENKELLIDRYKNRDIQQMQIPIQEEEVVSEPRNEILENREQKCQEQQAEYNSCLIRYNTKMIEWQNCQSGNKTFGCPLVAPNNSCGANISSWCRKQILGHY